jgi:hypothetical protein
MLPEYLQSYMSCNQYIQEYPLYVLSTYQYELELPNSFWRYYVFTFDNEKGYCVYGTGTWWCLNSKTVPDFMAIKHVIVPVQTQYIPVHTCMYRFRHFAPVCTQYKLVHTCMYQNPWFRTTGHDSRCTWHTTSSVHIVYDIACTYDVACQHTTSYVRRTMSYVCWRWSFQLF